MKKFLSLLLTLSCVFAFTIPAFAAENTSDSSFENDVIFAEVSFSTTNPITTCSKHSRKKPHSFYSIIISRYSNKQLKDKKD